MASDAEKFSQEVHRAIKSRVKHGSVSQEQAEMILQKYCQRLREDWSGDEH
jgi:hypothetical protein